jgi:acetyl esterase/lipase
MGITIGETKHTLFLVAVGMLLATAPSLFAQDHRLPLYTGAPPNSRATTLKEQVESRDIKWVTRVQEPGIDVFLPTKKFATGQAVVICPGGGYGGLAYDYEGTDIARYLNSIGVAGIVLKYRLPSADSSVEPHLTPLLDAKRAMRLVRVHAAGWNIDPARVGIMGFSAGGHLAATLGTQFDAGDQAASDPIERERSRPDFMILMYPVISFVDAAAHTGSRRALLGETPDPALVTRYSAELQVKANTPPTFMVHADNDKGVPVENALLMYRALRQKQISVELHILSEGGHGFGLGLDNAHVSSWPGALRLWLRTLLPPKP